MSNTPIHIAWMKMNVRCNNPSYEHYHRYGGRGIQICERWKSFENFYADMASTWRKGLTLDRYPNLDGNYEPGNVRWATPSQQCNNRSTNVIISCHGANRTLAEWAQITGIKRTTISLRLSAGWSPEEALANKPRTISDSDILTAFNLLREGKSLRNVSTIVGIPRTSLTIKIKAKFHELSPLLTDEERSKKFYTQLEALVYAN